jgi:hypothetical protein
MNKIKNYKINLRQACILRILKNTTQVSQITPQLEEAVTNEIARVQAAAVPAAGFVTLMRDKVPAELAGNALANWVAATLYLVTIGSRIESEIAEARSRGESILGNILHASAMEALEQSVNFIYRLVTDEAKDEECELSSRDALTLDETASARFVQLIDPEKIGVSSIAGDNRTPAYTACGIIYWTPVKKRKK